MYKRTAVATLLSSIVLVACGPSGQPPAAGQGGPGAAMPPAEVEVVTVSSGTATLTQDLPGRLQAWRTAQVTGARGGRC